MDKQESGNKNWLFLSKRLCLDMVVATETSEGEVASVVGGIYDDWHFGHVRGYTKHSVKLMLMHELAGPWAEGTANKKATLRKSLVRMLNLNEMERVAIWEKKLDG
jgi:hypothetical protein